MILLVIQYFSFLKLLYAVPLWRIYFNVAVPPSVTSSLLHPLGSTFLCTARYGRVVWCCRSNSSPIRACLVCIPTPPSTSTCTLAIFSIVWIPHPGLPLSWEQDAFPQGSFWCETIYSWRKKRDICVSFLAVSVISTCNDEHLQAVRGPLSSGCYHYPASQNMEKQVVCRWELAVIFITYATVWFPER